MLIRYALLPLTALFAAAAADAPPVKALSTLQPGKWDLSSRDGDFVQRTICLGDPRVLIQLRNPTATCSRFVVTNDPARATIYYTCPGAGHGQTTVRVETPRLAQIETQGVDGNAPFDLSIEARRTGECTALSQR